MVQKTILHLIESYKWKEFR